MQKKEQLTAGIVFSGQLPVFSQAEKSSRGYSLLVVSGQLLVVSC